MWKKILGGVVGLGVLGFAVFQGYLYSIQYYATAPVYQTSKGALDGYDPVAYFNEARPVLGKLELTSDWNGATWHFASADNLAAFKADPAKYAPQFGGYCAYGVSQGHTVKTEPDAWAIENGKLYLNFDKSIQTKWIAGKQDLIPAAEKNWPKVIER